jgi:hypothetical protein
MKKSVTCRALSDWGGMYGWIWEGVLGKALCGRRPTLEERARRMTNATVGGC